LIKPRAARRRASLVVSAAPPPIRFHGAAAIPPSAAVYGHRVDLPARVRGAERAADDPAAGV